MFLSKLVQRDLQASIAYNILERMLLNENEKPRKLPLSLLEAITNNFSNEQEIGRGGFAVVYKGMLRIGKVAVKKLSETLDLDDQKYSREVHCLMKARHKNIVRFLGYCSETQGEMVDYEGTLVMADIRNRLLCFEFVPGGNLSDYITDAYSGLEWRVRYQIIKGICEGLHYLHENRIVHLDLKPANILLDGKMVPKIADFGISRCFDEKQSKDITSKLIGSIGYLAPEYYNGHITMKLDIYSLGVIIIEVLTGKKGYFAIEKVLDIWRNRLELPEGDTPLQQIRACAETGMRCIDFNPDNRPTIQCIMQKIEELESAFGFVEAGAITSLARQMFRDAAPETDIQGADPRNNTLFGINGDGHQLGFPMGADDFLSNGIDADASKYQNHISTDIDGNYRMPKDGQQEISSSMVSQSFGASDMAFNSIDSGMNDGGLVKRASWSPAPPLKRMRIFTKVYKRGAVGRSVDISQFNGYDELKHALARMFSMEGQLEERQRIGWKLVYKDHEDDMLLVGEDPWEEFVYYARCIRILSPHEVQWMGLDGDLGGNVVPSQACSSSDGGNAWRARCDQNSGNPSTGSYDQFDAQQAKIQLMHRLMACAEATEQHSFSLADVLVKVTVAAFQGTAAATRKVAIYFGEALNRRRLVYGSHPTPDSSSSFLDGAFADLLHAHFYESCPYLKFAHFTANQAILEAFAGCRRVHVVDLDIKRGMQWSALLQALALRPEGPPSFRLTGVGAPQAEGNTEAHLQQVGRRLAQYAHTLRIDFQYRSLVASSLADLEPFMLRPDCEETDDEPEVIAVNSVFELHRLLAVPGALEKVLGTVRAVRPRIVIVAEQDANHNAGSFLDRFTESLGYYSAMFEALEGAGSFRSADDKAMSEVYLSQQICNVVACEGTERTERHETLGQWRDRLLRAGFEPHRLGSHVREQASTLPALFHGGNGYRVDEKDGCLRMGWRMRPLIATSAWRVADSDHDNL